MSWMYSACLALSSPNMRSRSTSENPMIALSGVRSSWDMLARNSDLCRLAASSSRLFSSSSRNRCAFAMATFDWAASVFMRFTIARRTRPGSSGPPRCRGHVVAPAQGHREHRPQPFPEEEGPEGLSWASSMSGIWTGCRSRWPG